MGHLPLEEDARLWMVGNLLTLAPRRCASIIVDAFAHAITPRGLSRA